MRRAACEFQHGMYANLGEEKKTSWDSICFPYECEVGWNDIWFFAIFKVKKWHLALLGPKKMIFKEKKYFQKFAQGLRSIIYSQGISILDPHTLHGGSGSRSASSSIWFGSGSKDPRHCFKEIFPKSLVLFQCFDLLFWSASFMRINIKKSPIFKIRNTARNVLISLK